MTAILDAASEALRRYEQGGKKLNPWNIISAAQKEGWRTKTAIVFAAMFDAIERDPTVIEAVLVAHDDRVMGKVFTTEGIEAVLRTLKAHVLG